MGHAALLLAAAAALAEPSAAPRGAESASVRVSAQILQPAVVRQNGGPQNVSPDAPRPQITRRGAQVLVEYQ